MSPVSEVASEPILRVNDLSVTYAPPRKGTNLGTGAALRGVTLDVLPGEIVGIVGETGSGKTTLARATVGLVPPASGSITFAGRDIGALRGAELRRFRRGGEVQLVFQDPLRSLDPDLTVEQLVAEPLAVAGQSSKAERRERVAEALRLVGLEYDEVRGRLPRQLSGGQRQRVSLARAIITRPQLLFCDEPVSALDVSNRNLVLSLLDRLRSELGLAVVIIAHDLSSLAGIADRIAVFYRSRLVELGPVQEVLTRPAHPYTGLLTASAPSVAHEDRLSPAEVRLPVGAAPREQVAGECVFAGSCRFVHDACQRQPVLAKLPAHPGREAACHVAGSWIDQVGADRAAATSSTTSSATSSTIHLGEESA